MASTQAAVWAMDNDEAGADGRVSMLRRGTPECVDHITPRHSISTF